MKKQWMTRATLIVCVHTSFLMFGALAQADTRLAEWLFWDQVGKQVGDSARAHQDYRQERELWQRKIAEAKEELKRCGGCASAKAKLAKWQGIENRFQDVAGSLAQSVNMPPVVAKWLGINMPMGGGALTPEQLEQYKLVRKPWVYERPPFCQAAVDKHLDCLREYQAKHGLRVKFDDANSPGGSCYATRKQYNHCYAKDYDAFEREKRTQARRAQGEIIPEFVEDGLTVKIYWGNVPENFVPPTPPADLVQSKFIGSVREFEQIMDKEGSGVLHAFMVKRFWEASVLAGPKCREHRNTGSLRDEIRKRECEDINALRYKPLCLFCVYANTNENHGGTRVAKGIHVFWYDSLPEKADPAYLFKRSADHPLLFVGNPRIDCPATKQAAERIMWDQQKELDAIRKSVTTISPIIAIRQGCEKGDGEDCEKLALLYRSGDGVQMDKTRALKLLETACNGGTASSCIRLANEHIRDASVARKYYVKACEVDDVKTGCLNAGHMLRAGIGGPKDSAGAIKAYEKLCAIRYPKACSRLEQLKNIGKSVAPAKPRLSRNERLKQECDAGNARSCMRLAMIYDRGSNNAENDALALKYYRQACAMGNAHGCANARAVAR